MKQPVLYHLTVSEYGLAGSLWLRVPHEAAEKVLARVAVISRLSGKRTPFQDDSGGWGRVSGSHWLLAGDTSSFHLELTAEQGSKSVSKTEVTVLL